MSRLRCSMTLIDYVTESESLPDWLGHLAWAARRPTCAAGLWSRWTACSALAHVAGRPRTTRVRWPPQLVDARFVCVLPEPEQAPAPPPPAQSAAASRAPSVTRCCTAAARPLPSVRIESNGSAHMKKEKERTKQNRNFKLKLPCCLFSKTKV